MISSSSLSNVANTSSIKLIDIVAMDESNENEIIDNCGL